MTERGRPGTGRRPEARQGPPPTPVQEQPDPIANVAAGWKRTAGNSVAATPLAGLSAAVWTERGDAPQEVSARPNSAIHSLAFTRARVEAQAIVDGRMVFSGTAPAGSCNLVQPGEEPRGVFRGPWEMLHVYLPDAFLRHLVEIEEFARPPGGFALVNPRWTVQPRLRSLAREMRLELASGLPFGRMRLDALGLDLAVELLRRHSTLGRGRGSASAETGALAAWQLRRACQAMEASLDVGIDLTDLAAAVGLSPSYFGRAFRRSTGLPPFAWMLRRRIERAQELLADRRLSLAEVALAVGFAAQPQFTTAFRRVTGTTPGAWRRDGEA